MTVRVGLLGAAWIAADALIKPAAFLRQQNINVEINAVACRDENRAKEYAKANKIPRIFTSYQELVEDKDIDAIYVPLPNSLHHKWSIEALRNGKHVLCEKPFASNAQEAAEMVEEAQKSGKFIVEAFHYRFHPAVIRLEEIVRSGTIGRLESLDVNFSIPIFKSTDIRFNWDLAGGSLMDTGSYAVNMTRCLANAGGFVNAPVVENATATLFSEQIDKQMLANVTFKDGENELKAKVQCSLKGYLPKIYAYAKGTEGEIYMLNFVVPHFYHKISITDKAGNKKVEKLSGALDSFSTYAYQLRAFVNLITTNDPSQVPYPLNDCIPNMQLIDDIYKAAGLSIRGAK